MNTSIDKRSGVFWWCFTSMVSRVWWRHPKTISVTFWGISLSKLSWISWWKSTQQLIAKIWWYFSMVLLWRCLWSLVTSRGEDPVTTRESDPATQCTPERRQRNAWKATDKYIYRNTEIHIRDKYIITSSGNRYKDLINAVSQTRHRVYTPAAEFFRRNREQVQIQIQM